MVKLEKTDKNPIFGPIWTHLVHFGAKTFFFQKSKNVTFLDLLKAKIDAKDQKNVMMGSMRTLVTDGP